MTTSPISKARVLQMLDRYPSAFQEEEAETLTRIRAFASSTEDLFSKANLHGQITASAIPFREETREILFIWHEKLQRWLQPGGHVEPEDNSLQEAALRELMEETELSAHEILYTGDEPLIDLDIHQIPGKGAFPAHWHHDFRFLFGVDSTANIGVKHRWIPIRELQAWEDPSISRYAVKIEDSLCARRGEIS